MQNTSPQDELIHAPLLKKMQGMNPYRVPEGYFDMLFDSVEKKLVNKPAVIRRISYSRIAARFAAAASIILFMGTAGWLYFNKSGKLQEEFYFTPEQISNSFYMDDLDLTLLKEEAAYRAGKESTNEIENYLLEHDITFLFELSLKK